MGPTVSEQLFVYFHSIQYIVFQYANSFVVLSWLKYLLDDSRSFFNSAGLKSSYCHIKKVS